MERSKLQDPKKKPLPASLYPTQNELALSSNQDLRNTTVTAITTYATLQQKNETPVYCMWLCVKAYPNIPVLAARAKIENLHTFMAAVASLPLLLSFVNATFCVEIKLCLFLRLFRSTCIFRKD